MTETLGRSVGRRWTTRRVAVGVLGAALVLATFAYFLPTIADYRDVWDVAEDLSWKWLLALAGATAFNLATFAPPWVAALPGLRFRPAFMLSQASTALSIVMPAGAAVGLAGSYALLRSLGFGARDVRRAVTLTSLWNQFANLSYPIVALALLTASGEESPVLSTAAFVGVGILAIAIAALVLVLAGERTAGGIGELAARLANRVLGGFGRAPVGWGGASLEEFRLDTVSLLRGRWHALTLATLAGSLTVFLVLIVSLRAFGVGASEVTVVEAFAAWTLVRLIGSIPITPGGIGIVELGLTGALLGFGGSNAGVVAAVLVFRFLTVIPTVLIGLVVAAAWRRAASASARARTGAAPVERRPS